MAGFVAMGDVLIGAAAFAAGVYFADWAKGAWEWIKGAIGWVKGKF